MRICIVGLSLTMPYSFAEALEDLGAQITFAWDYSHEKAEEFSVKHGSTVVDNWEAIPSLEVDGVLICSINCDHGRFARPFIEAGIPVFINKPFMTSYKEAYEIVKLAEDKKSVLMSCSDLRYAPAFRALAARVKENIIGKTLMAVAFMSHTLEGYVGHPFYKWHIEPDKSGGMIVDLGIHAVEIIHMALGGGIESVFCETSKVVYPDIETEDTALIAMKLRNGCLGTAQILGGANFPEYTLTIYGSKKSLRASVPGDVGSHMGGPYEVADPLYSYGYRDTMKEFLRSIKEKRCPIPLKETLEIAKTLQAARDSFEQGRRICLDNL